MLPNSNQLNRAITLGFNLYYSLSFTEFAHYRCKIKMGPFRALLDTNY